MSSGGSKELMAREPASMLHNSAAQQVVLPDKAIKTNRLNRAVLNEAEYLDKLGDVIQRDFFPDLPKLKAQNEYLEAVSRNDVAKIRALQMRYNTHRRTDKSQLNSPTRRSPRSTFDAPTTSTVADKNEDGAEKASRPTAGGVGEGAFEQSDDGVAMKKARTDGLSLDQFLNRYTSEDNASFEELTQLAERRERIRQAWMYRMEVEHNKTRSLTTELRPADEQLALPAPPRPLDLDNWKYRARNTVLFHPADAAFTDDELFNRRKMAERAIVHDNTRLPADVFEKYERAATGKMEKANVQAAAVSAHKGQIDYSGEQATIVGRPPAGAMTGHAAHGQYGLLATPSPAPGVNESPMMTWGEIEGSPFRLDAGDLQVSSTQPLFKIPDVPHRDQLHNQITDELAKRYNQKRKTAVAQASAAHVSTPKFGSTRSTTQQFLSMSPAARRLASNKLGIRLGTDKALKQSYTPSPRRTPKLAGGTPTPSRTPTSSKKSGSSTSTTPRTKMANASLTDNLLNLNKPSTSTTSKSNVKLSTTSASGSSTKPSAADFF